MKGKAESAAQKAWFIVHDGQSPVNSAGGTSGGSEPSTIGTPLSEITANTQCARCARLAQDLQTIAARRRVDTITDDWQTV